ncbi:MAG: anaerobic ribonucleoside triphosphate reductase [Christensenellales bacterium]|jgi:anaerobic ribonucleoside-triphosphate reductase
MITQIEKRDGRIVDFDLVKIKLAISKALRSAGEEGFESDVLAKKVLLVLEKDFAKRIPTVEQVQDVVERVLMQNGYQEVAKNYILYRAKRNEIREMQSSLMRVFDEINNKNAKDSDIKKENANINGDTPMGVMLKFGTEASKDYFHKFVLEEEFSKLHKNGDIHIHDLDFYSLTTTCCQIDIKKLFKNGFSTGHGFLREPNDINVYAALACIAIQSNQNDQHGGQSIPNFDYAMADGVKKTYKRNYYNNFAKCLELYDFDSEKILETFKILETETGHYPTLDENKAYINAEEQYFNFIESSILKKARQFALKYALKETDRATFQAMEALVHNLNTMHSRAGAQVPFSSINLGTDTSSEGRMVTKNFLLTTEKGLGYGETPIFPISIFKVKEGVNYNKTDPNYDLFRLALRVSSKRLFPNFSFLDAPFNLQYYKPNHPETEVAYMGCRTRVMSNVYKPENEVVFGRGNLSFTSINLPRIALDSNKNLDTFYSILLERMQSVVDQLKHRFEIQKNKTVKNFPFLMGQGVWIDSDNLKHNDKLEDVLKNGTLSVGFIGLAETLKVLTGKHHGESKEAQKLGLEIVGFMRNYLDKLAQEEKLNYSLIATPAEGLSGRFVKLDRAIYGNIEGVTDREYYTNSFHVPVYHQISAFDKISLEAPYHALTNAGHISYVELDGDISNNITAFEKVVRHMKESGVGYGSVNHPIDRDPVCGYSGVIGKVCPKCGREEGDIGFERIRRITGYLVGTLDRFNKAKFAEVRDRLKHNV